MPDIEELNARFAGADPQDILAFTLRSNAFGPVCVVSSFGTESAVLLHMISAIDPRTPILFLETGKHFPETLVYRETLAIALGLCDVRDISPDPELVAAKDEKGLRYTYDPDFCCELRKVKPLEKALDAFEATITGRKSHQATTRAALRPFEKDGSRHKINPLAHWDRPALKTYFREHDLPRHPLEAEGYLSIGCAPCTSKVLPGEDPRAGRWRQFGKIECGIHTRLDSPGKRTL